MGRFKEAKEPKKSLEPLEALFPWHSCSVLFKNSFPEIPGTISDLASGINYILLFVVIRKLDFIVKHKIYVYPELLYPPLEANLLSLSLNQTISMSHVILVWI
jgi:hypothetical protein